MSGDRGLVRLPEETAQTGSPGVETPGLGGDGAAGELAGVALSVNRPEHTFSSSPEPSRCNRSAPLT